MEDGALSKPAAVLACAAMASFYVGILYAPTLILRLPPPSSHTNFLIRRFICAGVSSLVSVVVSAILLPIKSGEASQLIGVYGIRIDHIWQAVVFPLALTALMYAGSLTFMSLLLIHSLREDVNCRGGLIKSISVEAVASLRSIASSVMHWRNYVVAPVTEELVFRACMIPLLLCAGFQKNTVIFVCPIFFSLAHLNHLMDVYNKQQNNWTRACMIIGLQLGYTVVFGSYASFLFIRTGHFLAPVVAHMFCNIMGLPLLVSPGKGIVSLAFLAGLLGFLWLLFPITNSGLYNDRTDTCRCWQGYCSGN
ncbi:PREDICTED: CAAX prenyl protease 2 [Fragaria vesca subsp. vesca]|uniref:CAAX prenyl protease 2 n=1 Tax=Fragaria vesca subsp. vesca TaxID=101020 RepID=UPI0002C310C1|nr:PREDICTED: CAAX prenyl protease 2 [Fragaria vesca subsp. vesca]